MSVECPKYLGKVINKDHFRVFIYGADGQKKLIESWEQFQSHMQTGLWFATKEEAKKPPMIQEEPFILEIKKRGRKAKEVNNDINSEAVSFSEL